MGVWLYDEKGYPSASADGLTMLGHPEYEARGFAEICTDGADWVRPDTFEKIIFACKEDGSPVPFDANITHGADRVYVVRPVFEGSHAQKCGFGPRHYPNIMDPAAVKAFLRCTYDRYFEKTGAFSSFEAVFTDEPSLMSAFVNCSVPMPHAFLPWAEELPAVFREMHGRELWEDIPVLFSREARFEEGKVRFWRTVAEMVCRARDRLFRTLPSGREPVHAHSSLWRSDETAESLPLARRGHAHRKRAPILVLRDGLCHGCSLCWLCGPHDRKNRACDGGNLPDS